MNLFYVLCCVVKLQVSVNFLPETFLVIEPQPELVLKLFLNSRKFESRSFKVVLIKKSVLGFNPWLRLWAEICQYQSDFKVFSQGTPVFLPR